MQIRLSSQFLPCIHTPTHIQSQTGCLLSSTWQDVLLSVYFPPCVCVCLPVGLVVRIDSSEALAPSDGSGVEASDRSNGQRHGGESSGWTPCTEQRRRAINRLLTPQNGRLIDHVFVISPTPDNVFSLFVYQFFVCHNWLVCHNLIFLSLEAE